MSASFSPTRLEVCNTAIAYVDAGISVVPLRLDGSKAPFCSWKPFQSRKATQRELNLWFEGPVGIGIVCGLVSGGLEVLDFDERAEETLQQWRELLPDDLESRLCICLTGGQGYHVIYRSNVVCKNTKIANTRDRKVLIESRGEGGYIVGVGSPAKVHASGRPYEQIQGLPLPALPYISEEERTLLWRAAASLGETATDAEELINQRANELRPCVPVGHDSSTPWGDFDARANWREILEPAGWQSRDGEYWTRPGKDGGPSAHVILATSGIEILTVFSTNAGPLAPESTGHRNWGKFAAYTALHHDGDRREAARQARKLGYGEQRHE